MGLTVFLPSRAAIDAVVGLTMAFRERIDGMKTSDIRKLRRTVNLIGGVALLIFGATVIAILARHTPTGPWYALVAGPSLMICGAVLLRTCFAADKK